jgi:uncharacterized protein (TIGR02300 family)
MVRNASAAADSKRAIALTAAFTRGKGARFRETDVLRGSPPLANPELGSKQLCPNCQAKFYDLNKRPAHCPKCATEFDPDEAVRNRRVRARAVAPEPEEVEDQVKPEADEDEEEEEVVTPELDEVVDDPPLAADDDEDAAEPGVAPVSEDLGEFTDDEEVEDDADVPFLEEEEDDDFDDSEIEGLPGEDDVDDR